MDFTKENVSKYWYLLHHSNSSEEKHAADTYLTSFKKSDQVMIISLELFQSNNESERVFASFVIYQFIKEHLQELLESKPLFLQYKSLFFNQIMPLMTNSIQLPQIIIEKICLSISLLTLIGLITFWPEAIDELLGFAKQSYNHCYLAMVILAGVSQELTDLGISQKKVYMIKAILIDHKETMKQFIYEILKEVQGSDRDVQVSDGLYMKTIELTKAWVGFELNVLSLPQMTSAIIMKMNMRNMEVLAELFDDSITYSSNAKMEDSQQLIPIEDYLSKANMEQMESIGLLIRMIKQFVMERYGNKEGLLPNINEEEIRQIHALARIFSSLTENYVFLFFLKDSTSKDLLDLLYFFLAYPNRAISSKFFEGINTIKSFINTDYKFSNLTNEEKIDFLNYMLRLTQGVMLNCRLKSFNKINTSDSVIQVDNDENDYEINSQEISINSYRKNAEDFFFNIFNVFAQNFKEEGVLFFLKNITQVLVDININDPSILTDNNKLLTVDTVLFVIMNIVDCFESMSLSTSQLVEFIQFILHSQLINNEHIVRSFLLFIEQSSCYITYDQKFYEDINHFLISTARYKPLEVLSTMLLLNVNQASNVFSIDVFKGLYQYYLEQYNLMDIVPLGNIAEALCSAAGIQDKNKILISMTYNELAKYYHEILKPALEHINAIVQALTNNNNTQPQPTNYDQIIVTLSKSYAIIEKVHKHVFFLENMDFLWEIFEYNFIQNYNNTSVIFTLFSKNTPLINQISILYIKITQKLGDKCLSIFDQLNSLMLNSYSVNPENFYAIIVLKNLYKQTGRLSPEKAKYISSIFFVLIGKITMNIRSNFNHKNSIETLDSFAQFILNLLEEVVYAEFSNENIVSLTQGIDLLIEGLRNVIENSLITNILKVFTALITSKIVPCNVIQGRFTEMIVAAYESLDHYSPKTINALVTFTSHCLNADMNVFLGILKQMLESDQFKTFKKEHVEMIIEYFIHSRQQDNNLKKIINDLINIAKGMGQVDLLNHYGLELARLKIKKV